MVYNVDYVCIYEYRSMASIVNWGCNFLVGLLFPYMVQGLGAWSFAHFSAVLILTFFYVYCFLPETHGRSVEEIQRLVRLDDDKAEKRAWERIQNDDVNEDVAAPTGYP
jgi:hypothetical protein